MMRRLDTRGTIGVGLKNRRRLQPTGLDHFQQRPGGHARGDTPGGVPIQMLDLIVLSAILYFLSIDDIRCCA